MKEGESRMSLQRRINIQLVCKGVGNVMTFTIEGKKVEHYECERS